MTPLLIAYVIMPNMDGYELAPHVQKNYPHIKIQMVSGFTDDRLRHIIDNALQQEQLYKPYTSDSLLTNVRHLLDKIKTIMIQIKANDGLLSALSTTADASR